MDTSGRVGTALLVALTLGAGLTLFLAPIDAPAVPGSADRAYLAPPASLSPAGNGGHPIALNGQYRLPTPKRLVYYMRGVQPSDGGVVVWQANDNPDPTGVYSGHYGDVAGVTVQARVTR